MVCLRHATASPEEKGGAHFIIFKSELDGGVQNLFCAPAVSRQAPEEPARARQRTNLLSPEYKWA